MRMKYHELIKKTGKDHIKRRFKEFEAMGLLEAILQEKPMLPGADVIINSLSSWHGRNTIGEGGRVLATNCKIAYVAIPYDNAVYCCFFRCVDLIIAIT